MNKNKSYSQSRWGLNDLFDSLTSPDIENTFVQIKEKVNRFENRRDLLKADISVEDFLSIIKYLEEISRDETVLYGFAGLSFAADTQNQAAQTLVARIDQLVAEITNQTLFFSLWWKDLDNESAARLLSDAGDFRYWLEEMRHFKPHTLTEPEEKVVNIKNVTGTNALGVLYDSITNRYTFKISIQGEEQELTRGELMALVRRSDPELRALAYQELYRVYGNDGLILGQMYQTVVRDWYNEQITLRKFPTPIAARNLVNDIPDDAVDTLLDVCKQNVGLFQRFFRLKARWLGMDKLRRYDLYAPVAHSEKNYPFAEAARMVFDSFSSFDPQFSELAQRVFQQNHLDSEVRKGKRGGAFCWTVLPTLPPWVLLNYQGHADDVATMAHELGHAIHSMLASEHSLFTAHACLPLAETASTFGEMMLVDRLLQQESDDRVRRDILFRQVDDAYATIMRQSFFAMFERKAHAMIRENASVDELATAYLENLREQFGDAVEVSDEFRWEWVSIPHIYNVPFYVYAYSFGQLLVLSLYKQYKAEGEAFKPRYIQLLSAGGSEAPAHLLAKSGIDIRQASFWQGGFEVIREMIDQLESLPMNG